MKTHIYTLFIFLLTFVFIFSCSKETTDNSSEGPLTELEWLKNIKQDLEISAKPAGAQIIQYTYHQNTVFWVNSCYNCGDNLIEIYNYEGEVICEMGGIAGLNTCPDFFDTATECYGIMLILKGFQGLSVITNNLDVIKIRCFFIWIPYINFK